MRLPLVFQGLALATTVTAECTAKQRIDALKYIVKAFNEPDFQKSAALINGMPLAPTCEAYLYIDGLPGIEPAFDATTVKDFSQVVRQAFAHVEAKYSAAGNNTATLDALVTLGVLHVIPSPVYTHIVVPAEFDEQSCLITKLPTYITIPSDIAGNPINPPQVPAIPGLAELPGIQPILQGLTGLLKDAPGAS